MAKTKTAKKKARKKAPAKKTAPAKRAAVAGPATLSAAATLHEGVAVDMIAAANRERVLNCVPSKHPDSDWNVAHALAAGIDVADDGTLPAEVDLRESWWEIGNQLSTGSCVGWALADSVLRWHFVKAAKLNPGELLSTRFIWMASKETDEFASRPESFIEQAGTSLKAALDVARKYGCVVETLLPFNAARLFPGDGRTFYLAAARLRILMYVRIRRIHEWRGWLAKNGPILVRVEVDKTFRDAPGGRLDFYDPFPSDSSEAGGHAVAIVGYTRQGEFIVRNSWGKQWGDQGYALAREIYLDKAVSEAYGVYV